MFKYKIIFLIFFVLIFWGSFINCSEIVLYADFRDKPPDLYFDKNNEMTGPLKIIIDIAVKRAGYKIIWSNVPFLRSLENLKKGNIDIEHQD